MDLRLLTLALPSLVILGVLVVHSWKTLPGPRAIAFWVSVVLYGFLRGLGVQWITRTIGASFPYEIRRPLAELAGVSLQEIAGWAIVAYLAWWFGSRFAERRADDAVFAQAAWGCLFLGAISWAIESAAIAARWWHWTVPVSRGWLLNVPFIGIVDWLFVNVDFLLPFILLTSARRRPVHFLSLLFFPVHFGAHLLIEPLSRSVPLSPLHLVHWALLALLVWLALRSELRDRAFARAGKWLDRIPLLGAALMLADIALVQIFAAREPRLLIALAPLVALVAVTLQPSLAAPTAIVAAIAALFHRSFLLAGIPPLVASGIRVGRANKRWAPAVAAMAMVVLGVATQTHSANEERELTRRIDGAIAMRDQGRLDIAVAELETLTKEFPTAHVPFALLGEIYYRTGHPDLASDAYEQVVEIKNDYVQGHRTLAVIALQRGEPGRARDLAGEGLAVAPDDLELRLLEARANGTDAGDVWTSAEQSGQETTLGLIALAFEVDAVEEATAAADRAIARWPRSSAVYQTRLRLALAAKDSDTARRTVAHWIAALPQDPAAQRAAAAIR